MELDGTGDYAEVTASDPAFADDATFTISLWTTQTIVRAIAIYNSLSLEMGHTGPTLKHTSLFKHHS